MNTTMKRLLAIHILPALIGGLMLSGMTARAGDVPNSAQDVRPLLIGSTIPDVTLKTSDGNAFDL